MSQKKPWVNALKISLSDYEKWTTEISKEENITFWAMDKGKIKAQDYLFWAREHYQIPVLKDSWFKEHCNHQLWNQIQSVANWSPHMMPIDEWDGTIFVAVVEPPSDVQWSFPVTYVLAHARALKSHWKTLQTGPSEAVSEEPLPPDMAAVTEEESQPVFYPSDSELPPIPDELPNIPESMEVPGFEMTDTGVSMQDVDGQGADDSDEVDHLASIEIPSLDSMPSSSEFVQSQDGEGDTDSEINMNIPEVNEVMSDGVTTEPDEISESSLKIPMDLELELPEPPTTTQIQVQETAAPSVGDSPEGISLDLSDAVVSDASPEGISLDIPMTSASDANPEGISFELPEFDGTPEGMEFTSAPENPVEEPVQESAEAELPEETPAVAADDSTMDDTLDELGIKKEPEFKLNFDVGEGGVDDSPPEPTQLTNTTHTNEGTVTRFAITMTGVNKEAPKGAVVDTDKTAPHTSDACANESEAAAWLFSELKNHFQQSMILLYNGEELKPWKWENSWAPKAKDAFNGFDPDQPGLFRIIRRTKQPYHGYVVSSPLNKEFFKKWGFDNFPEHVTALPMIVEGHLTGIVLSLGDESSASDRALMDAEKMVNEFVATIVRVTSQAA